MLSFSALFTEHTLLIVVFITGRMNQLINGYAEMVIY